MHTLESKLTQQKEISRVINSTTLKKNIWRFLKKSPISGYIKNADYILHFYNIKFIVICDIRMKRLVCLKYSLLIEISTGILLIVLDEMKYWN